MTRDHAQAYTPSHDPYAAHRCECGHLVYADDVIGMQCRWFREGGCRCVNHRPKGGVSDAAQNTDAS
jgi:hypothetical protein